MVLLPLRVAIAAVAVDQALERLEHSDAAEVADRVEALVVVLQQQLSKEQPPLALDPVSFLLPDCWFP